MQIDQGAGGDECSQQQELPLASESPAIEPYDEPANRRAPGSASPQRRGTLRRNLSLPSLVDGDCEPTEPLLRSCSDGEDQPEDAVNFMEVDGKVVLAPQSERLKHKSNPYVGTFHYGHRASKMLTGASPPGSRKSSPPQDPQPVNQAHDGIAHSPLLAAAPSPALSKLGIHDAAADIAYCDLGQAPHLEALEIGQVQVMGGTNGGIKKKNCSSNEYDGADGIAWPSLLESPLRAVLSQTASSDGDMAIPKPASRTYLHDASDCPAPRLPSRNHPDQRSLTSLDRERMKKALQLKESVPADPEMCGLQALLPRQAGIVVQYKIGEGSFGKCVKVLNRKNRQEWSTATSKRGIARHLNEIPKEGESLVIKYIKKTEEDSHIGHEPYYTSSSETDIVQREIRIHGKCNHPNIVRLFGHYELGAKVGLILGFVEGVELHDVLHVKRRLPEEDTFTIMLQIFRATAYLHSIHIIHRDLKPRNVLVSSRLRAHVIDLGLAIDMSDLRYARK
jgi:hypothetical protein